MDLARDEEGAQIVTATSHDPRCPASSILGSDESLKWVTTGGFPQEIIVQLANNAIISKIRTWTHHVRRLIIEICSSPVPSKWEKVADIEIGENDGNVQTESQSIPREEALFIKFKILSGWLDFITIRRVAIEGKPGKK